MSLGHSELRDAYNEAAPAFAEWADRLVYARLATPLVDEVAALAGVHSGLVLDVAAGSGAFGRAIPGVIALDTADQQLAQNPAGRRVRADACALPFRRRAFVAAACAFGINHVERPAELVAEMARVAPVVGVSTWLRPEEPFAPKEVVLAAIERQVGRRRTPLGDVLERLNARVGSVEAVARLLDAAGVEARVHLATVPVPWPGVDAYVGYRISMPSTPRPADLPALRREVGEVLAELSPEELEWRAVVVVGAGRSRPG